jgi:methylenetetrahydrofolate reductase (NADPH)
VSNIKLKVKMDSQKKYKSGFSFEFFPPRTPESVAKLKLTQERLAGLGPKYFSVTYGAGGSTRENTFETVRDIRDTTGIEAAPHLSCVGSSKEDLHAVLMKYKDEGFRHLVALRGDLPSGSLGMGAMRYANELVEFIRSETGDYFHIDVACYPEFHPQAVSASHDLINFQRKVKAGANSAITQYFYNTDAYFRFIDSCETMDIDIPIVPGIMPIISCTQLQRFSEACGAEIPRWILQRLRDFGDDRESILEFGIEVTTSLCERLLDGGAPGLHFYTMNQATATEAVWKNLNLQER